MRRNRINIGYTNNWRIGTHRMRTNTKRTDTNMKWYFFICFQSLYVYRVNCSSMMVINIRFFSCFVIKPTRIKGEKSLTLTIQMITYTLVTLSHSCLMKSKVRYRPTVLCATPPITLDPSCVLTPLSGVIDMFRYLT